MNKYKKYVPNVWLAECSEPHEKGDVIEIETRYGKVNEHYIHNLIYEQDGKFYYSITRVDGYNSQVRAQNKADRYKEWADSRETKADGYYEASQEGKEFLVLAEPIKVGHHSEKRHRALIERNHNRMGKAVENWDKAQQHEDKAAYWLKQAEKINLSMPESVEFYKKQLEFYTEHHRAMKAGEIERSHSMSLQYANRDKKQAEKNYQLAKKLWE